MRMNGVLLSQLKSLCTVLESFRELLDHYCFVALEKGDINTDTQRREFFVLLVSPHTQLSSLSGLEPQLFSDRTSFFSVNFRVQCVSAGCASLVHPRVSCSGPFPVILAYNQY